MKAPPRVLFRERHRLSAADLRSEQEYLLGLAGRHYIGPHEWGIVHGLAISVDNYKGIVTVAPGLAIDGYGRELALFRPVQLGIQRPAAKQYVYLYYCERPEGVCGDSPNMRWRDSAEITLSSEPWPVPDEEPNFIDARGAGSVPDAPAWPVLLAAIDRDTKGKFIVDLSECRFTRLRAARIISPSGHTVMRVGQENLADEYHLCISGRDVHGVMQDRLVFDRDGNPMFWGNLIITGSNLAALIATQIQGLSIKAIPKASVGADVRWRARLESTDGKQILKLSFRSKIGRSKQTVEDKFELILDPIPTRKNFEDTLKSFSSGSKLVTLKSVGKLPLPPPKSKRRSKAAVPMQPPPTAVSDDRELPIEYDGGALNFEQEDVVTPSIPCGCADPFETPKKLPEGFVFRPGPAVPIPPSRDIYCLLVKPENQAPSEELRVSGGAFQEGDFGRRFTIGGFANSQFQAVLTLHGNGTVELVGKGQRDDNQRLYPMIQATGSIELPPVNPDPRDPFFNYLLVLAFINGVLSLSSSLLKITFSNLPASIDPSRNWSYDLTLENLSLTESLLALNNIETITVDQQSALLRTIPNLPQKIDSKQSVRITVRHTPQDVPIPTTATKLVINVSVAMRAGSLTVASKAISNEIPVQTGVS
jgi:hypothetical protein